MKLGQLLEHTALQTKNVDQEILGVTADSRRVEKDWLFVALSPDTNERRAHIQDSIARGASMIICPLADQYLKIDHAILFSEDCRQDYGVLASNWFGCPSHELCMIGVTGTNGKTTTTHLIKEMLETATQQDYKVGLIGTNEIKIGENIHPATQTTPDAYQLQQVLCEMVEEGCTHAVMEVSSHGLEQSRTAGITFAVGIFTNLTQDHLDYHKTMEGYQLAKEKLFLQSECAVINLNDPVGERLALKYKGFSYGENKPQATLSAQSVRLSTHSVDFIARTKSERCAVSIPIFGGYNLYNGLAALTCGLALGLPLQEAVDAISTVKGVKGRGEIVKTTLPCTVMIDYAHTPDALENILTMVRTVTQKRLICVFGCGGNRDKEKRPIMGAIAEDLADIVVITSDNPRTEQPQSIISDICNGLGENPCQLYIEPDRIKAIHWALEQGVEGDIVVLAGKGHECYQEIMGERYDMDEREIIHDFVSRMTK